MSSAGHVSDMNTRLKNNRDQMNARKERHQKVLDAYRQHPKHQALSDDKQLSNEEYEKFTNALHRRITSDRRKYWSLFFISALLITLLIGFLFFT